MENIPNLIKAKDKKVIVVIKAEAAGYSSSGKTQISLNDKVIKMQ